MRDQDGEMGRGEALMDSLVVLKSLADVPCVFPFCLDRNGLRCPQSLNPRRARVFKLQTVWLIRAWSDPDISGQVTHQVDFGEGRFSSPGATPARFQGEPTKLLQDP